MFLAERKGGRRRAGGRGGAGEDDGWKTERVPMSRSEFSVAQPFFRPILRRAAAAADGFPDLQRKEGFYSGVAFFLLNPSAFEATFGFAML